MSVLTIIQNVCRRTGLPVPNTALGSTDNQIQQLVALLDEEGNDLAQRGSWQGLENECALTTVATESQGTIDSIATNGFRYIINETIWDRTTMLPVAGAVTPKEWQGMKAVLSNGPRYSYRFRGNQMLVNPVPPAGEAWYFEYITQNWLVSADGNNKAYATLDTDISLLPETLVMAGLRWRWKKEKGFEYAEDMRTYEMQVKDAMGRNGGRQNLHMDGFVRPRSPGIFIPDMSWPLP